MEGQRDLVTILLYDFNLTLSAICVQGLKYQIVPQGGNELIHSQYRV